MYFMYRCIFGASRGHESTSECCFFIRTGMEIDYYSFVSNNCRQFHSDGYSTDTLRISARLIQPFLSIITFPRLESAYGSYELVSWIQSSIYIRNHEYSDVFSNAQRKILLQLQPRSFTSIQSVTVL